MPTVRVYTSTPCGFCRAAKRLLENKGVDFVEIDLSQDPDGRNLLHHQSGGIRTVPQIWVGDVHVGGYRELVAINQSGELDRLLQQTPESAQTDEKEPTSC